MRHDLIDAQSSRHRLTASHGHICQLQTPGCQKHMMQLLQPPPYLMFSRLVWDKILTAAAMRGIIIVNTYLPPLTTAGAWNARHTFR